MDTDRAYDATTETDEESRPDRPRRPPPPDRPGADGLPSRADSRAAAARSSRAEASSEAGEQAEDVRSRAILGAGASDDNARTPDVEDTALERGMLDRLKRSGVPRDRPAELTGTVDRPDFQDPGEHPSVVPDRYGTPLDGARTPLFAGEPVREQTQQGRLGDCGVIATLGAVAGHRPEAIRDCVRETEDGDYEVRLHEATYSTEQMRYEPTGRMITLTVTPDLPVYDADPARPAFADSRDTGAAWAPILEKAIAGSDQTWSDERRDRWTERWAAQGGGGEAPSGYVRLNQGSNASDRAELLTQLTGRPARTLEFPTTPDRNGRTTDQQLVDEFRERLEDHKPILVGTRARGDGEPPLTKKLAECHAYEVTKVDDQGRIHLRNPWNRRHPDPLTITEFTNYVRPRYSTLD
jgi:Calpain family cysteine protease